MAEELTASFQLSFQQKHLWLLQQEDLSQPYRAVYALSLEGPLDPVALKEALKAVVARHESLRTTLRALPGLLLPVQVIADEVEFGFAEYDLSSLDDRAQAAQIEQLIAEVHHLPIDLERGPPLYVALARIARQSHVLVLMTSALSADGVSLKQVAREIGQTYSGTSTILPDEPPTQYADLAEWQRELLESPETAGERAYWSNLQLATLLSTSLPYELPAPSGAGFRPQVHTITLPAHLLAGIQARTSEYSVSPAAFLLTCWQILLARLSERNDLVIGLTCEGRTYQELQDAVGLLTIALPIASRLDPKAPFSALLEQVETQIRESFDVQEYFSWEAIKGEIGSDAEVFWPFGFAYSEATAPYQVGDLVFTELRQVAITDRFMLNLACVQREQSLDLEFSYDLHRLPSVAVERIAAQLEQLVAERIANPTASLRQGSLVGTAERRTLLEEFNQTEMPYPSETCAHRLFEAQAARTPTTIAVVQGAGTCDQVQLSYAELNARANQLARALRTRGVGPETRVGICIERSIDMVVGLLGILKAGGAYVPLDPSYPHERLAFILADAQAALVVTQQPLLTRLPELDAGSQILCLDRDWSDIAEEAATDLDLPMSAASLAYIIYTSGSTGKPKGVMISHQGLVNYLSWAIPAYNLTEGQGTVVHSPLGFDLTITGLLAPLLAGQRVLLLPETHTLEALSSALRANHDLTLVKLTPAHVDALSQMIPASELAERVRALIIGGEALKSQQLTYWRTHAPATSLINEYGPTETVVGCCVYTVDPALEEAGSVPIGRPIANTQLYILSEHLDPVPLGVTGELYIGGAGVSRGYVNQPDLTAERFIPDPFGVQMGARLYRTGDLARYRADGQIEYLGRLDQQIKLRGYRIELGEIEAVLRQHPGVRETVVDVRHAGSVVEGKRLVAYIVQNKQPNSESAVVDSSSDEDLVAALRTFLQARLPEYMLPSAFVLLTHLPLTANGKIDRQALPEPQHQTVFAAPRTADEEILAAIWMQVLGVPRVGLDDNYFALGGDSIRSIQVVALAQARNLHFSLDQMFRHPTIRTLAADIKSATLTDQALPSIPPFSLVIEADRGRLPTDLEDAYPMTQLQGGMVFHNEYNPGSAIYHDIFSYYLKIPVQIELLRIAALELMKRHPALRTTFDVTHFSEPLQLVHREGTELLSVEDVSQLSETEQEATIHAWIADEKQRGFDVTQLPLVRFVIHLRSTQSFQFTLSFHHAVLDGWSDATMLTELFSHYLLLLRDEPVQIAPPVTFYRDFVALEQQAMESEAFQQFWDDRLSGSDFTRLPRWSAVSPSAQRQGVILPVLIPKHVSEGLKQIALTCAVPIKNVLLAAHLRVLSLLAGHDDVLTCMVSSGRPESADGDRVLGLFINSIPFRLKLTGGTWEDLVRETFEAERETLPFRRYPMAELQRRHGGRQLSETLFYFTHYHIFRGLHELGDLEVLEYIPYEVSSFTLAANFWVDPFTTDVNLSLTCDGSQLTQAQIEAISAYYANVFAAIALSPRSRYDRLSLLPATEQERMLREWNATATDYEQNVCLHHLIARQAARTPQAPAITFEDRQLSYAELDQRSNQLAHYLQRLGIGSDIRVGLFAERSPEMVIGLLGILKAGGCYVPLDPSYPAARLALMMEDADISVLLTQERLRGSLPPQQAQILCLDDWTSFSREPITLPSSPVTSANLAYIIYTSGSTGRPKGVMVSHQNVVNFFAGMDDRIGGEQPGTWLAVTSSSFDISVLELFWTLSRGFHVVIQGESTNTLASAAPATSAQVDQIDFSLFYFASDEAELGDDKYRLLIEGAKFADRHGFSAIWTPERHFHHFGGLYPNPSVIGGLIAGITERLQIRAGSVVLPLHQPVRIAEEWSVVDNLSHGRVGLSFASGWHEHDFVLAPEHYTDRKHLMLQGIETIRQLWRGEALALPGPSGQPVSIQIHPKPIQRELPIWLTAAGNPESFRQAGKLGVNLLTHLLGQSIEDLAYKIALYREAWQAHGHSSSGGHVTLMLHAFVGDDLDEVREKVRTPFCNYLKSSVDLVKDLTQSLGPDVTPDMLSPEDLDAMLNRAFDRYFETSGLLGTRSTCLKMVERLKAIGVNEIACLVDFGIDFQSTMDSLSHLDHIRQESNASTAATSSDFSVAAQIARHGVTHLQCTPSLASIFAASPETLQELRPLHTLMLGGETLPASLARQLSGAISGRLLNMYGPTETTIWSTTHTLSPDSGTVLIGRPIANTQVYVLDRSLQPVPTGSIGDLYIGGDGVVRGYLNNPALTAERFLPNPFSPATPGGRIYKTGDLARFLPDGTLDFVGRADTQVKLRGFRIELGEIEAVLTEQLALGDSIVMVRSDRSGEQRLVAYLVAAAGVTHTTADVRRQIQSRLPGYMLPSDLVFLDAWPLTPNGKIDRKALPVPTGDRPELAETFIAPRTPIQEVIASVWLDVLALQQVGIHDNFFQLGGYSLQATQIILRLRRIFQVDLPLRSLFESPTIAELAQQIEIMQQAGQGLRIPPLERVDRNQLLPLSFAQEGIWFLDQRSRGTASYNEPAAVQLKGSLDLAVLERSINEVVRRHEALRLSFSMAQRQPIAIVNAALHIPLPVIDLRTVPVETREAQARHAITAEIQRSFDLERAPLLRTTILELGEGEWMLLLVIHHIISDGWSIGVFIREVTEIYAAFAAGQPSPLPELPIQYVDVAYWQRQWLRDETMQHQIDYWKTQLGPNLPILRVPTDHPRPAVQTFEGATQFFLFPKELTEGLKILGQQEGATLFMTLMAAWQILLHYYSNQDDIVVGTDSANRNRDETEQLIGIFVNQLVIRTSLAGQPTVRETIQRVRETTLAAYAHQDAPFDRVVEALKPERDLSRTPLFQVKLVFQNVTLPEKALPNLQISSMEVERGTAKFDLLLNVADVERGLLGWLEYNTSLFESSTITQMIGQFELLLYTIVSKPDAALNALTAVLNAAEQQQQQTREQALQQASLQRLQRATRRGQRISK